MHLNLRLARRRVRKAQIPNRLIVAIPLDEQIALFCDAFERRGYGRELLFEIQ